MDPQIKGSNAQPSAKSIALKYGLVWTAINIFIFLSIYYVFPQLIAFGKVIINLINLGLIIYFILNIRKRVGGFWTFKEAVSSIFVLFIIPSILFFFFSIVFVKWVEPSYADKVLNATTEFMESITEDQNVIDNIIEIIDQGVQTLVEISFVSSIKILSSSVLIDFILSLIWAAIFKRDKPIFLTNSETEEI